MSLRKSPTRTPALLEANRRNARKSTGPRTARGKAQTRMNAFQSGGRSRLRRDLWVALLNAPPGRVEEWVQALMRPEMAWNQHLREVAEILIQAERETGQQFQELALRLKGKCGGKCFLDGQSRNVIEKIDCTPTGTHDVAENVRVIVFNPRCL